MQRLRRNAEQKSAALQEDEAQCQKTSAGCRTHSWHHDETDPRNAMRRCTHCGLEEHRTRAHPDTGWGPWQTRERMLRKHLALLIIALAGNAAVIGITMTVMIGHAWQYHSESVVAAIDEETHEALHTLTREPHDEATSDLIDATNTIVGATETLTTNAEQRQVGDGEPLKRQTLELARQALTLQRDAYRLAIEGRRLDHTDGQIASDPEHPADTTRWLPQQDRIADHLARLETNLENLIPTIQANDARHARNRRSEERTHSDRTHPHADRTRPGAYRHRQKAHANNRVTRRAKR